MDVQVEFRQSEAEGAGILTSFPPSIFGAAAAYHKKYAARLSSLL